MAKNDKTIVFLVIAALLAWNNGLLDGLLGQQVGGDVTPPEVQTIEVCDSTTTPSVTINAHNKYTGATLTGNVVYKVATYLGEGQWAPFDGIQTTTIGTAFAASPKDKVEYIVDAGSYHNVTGTFEVPCRETVPRSVELVGYDTTLNYTYLKNQDDTANTAAAQQAIGAGQTKKVRAQLESGSDVGGDYYMIVQYNATEFSKLEIPELGNAKSTPIFFTVDTLGLTAVRFDIGELADNQVKDFVITATADSTINPSTDMLVRIYSKDVYIDEAGGRAFLYGAEDENHVRQGDSTALAFNVAFS